MHDAQRLLGGPLRPRHVLLVAAVSIVVIGCLAVLSAADGSSTGSAFGYFAKAVGFGAVGCVVMMLLGRGTAGGLALVHRFATPLLAAGFLGVLFVMVPTPVTPVINGARQWIVLGPFTFQPSEILKPALVLYLASTLTRQPWRLRSWRGMGLPLGVTGAALAAIVMQDLGSGIVTAAVALTVIFAAGARASMLGGILAAAAGASAMLVAIAPERVERLTVFLAPFADRYDGGYQITNGLMAIGSGGIVGEGVGQSLQKHVIPEPQTDFILAVIMEEIGLLGASVIFVLYAIIVFMGLRIARATHDPYERLVAVGLSSILLWQAALNIWVVLGIAPLTGVPLPLISAGGTSQVILLAVLGLLLDIERRATTPTVPLVLPEAEPSAAPARLVAPPERGVLRVLDRRPAQAAPADEARKPERGDVHRAPEPRRARPSAARAAAPAAAPPQAPRIVETVGRLRICADGRVILPDGRIGRPRKPIELPGGRLLLPDGRFVRRSAARSGGAAR